MAHTFDTNLRFTGNSNPLTSAYTCGANATLLVIGIVTKGPTKRSGGAPTYNSVELTQADETRQYIRVIRPDYPETSCELWYLVEPGVSSAYQISIPNPTSLTLHIQASSYNVASGFTSALDVDGGNTGLSTSPSVSVTPTVNGAVIVGILGSGQDYAPTDQSGTELNATDNGLYSDSNQYTLQTVAAAIATDWTTGVYGGGVYGAGLYGGTDDWCMCVAAFKETNVSVTVEPDVIALFLSILLPSIDVDDSPTILPSEVVLELTLNAPTIVVDKTQAVSADAAELTLYAPTIIIDGTPVPSVIPLSLSLGAVSVVSEENVTVLPAVFALSLTVGASNVLAPLDTVRMMSFIFSSAIAYPVEFGNEYARFYFDGEPLLGDEEVHVEVETDYQSSELYQLQTKQSADVMWITHSSHPPAQLKRTTPTTFTLEDIVFEKGPFIERNDIANDDEVTMSVNVTEEGDAGILARSSGKFESGHIGALFKLTHPRVSTKTNGTRNYANTGLIGEAIDVYGDYIFSITSTGWSGTVSLQRSTDDWVSSTNIVTYTSGIQTYKATEATENVQYRINVTAHAYGLISAGLVANTSSVSGSATSVGVIGVPLDIKGDFNFNTHGNWDATVVVERNEDDAGWEPYRTYISVMSNGVGDRNVQLSQAEEDDNVQYRINVTAYTEGTVEADLAATSSTQSGIVRINGILSDTSAEITVVSKVSQTTETKRWAEGAWSGVRGYPSAITLFEERAVYGFTNSDQQDIWLSETGKFEDFEAGIKDADSFTLTIPTANRGKWLGSLETLAAGTAGGEWRIKAPLDEALAPKNWDIKKQTAYGSSDIQALEVGSVMLFVDFVGRKVREFTFRDEDQKYVAPDLTALAEHITVSGVVCFAHQRNPDSILWCVLANGDLITLSYEREQNVTAWAKHPMDGLVQSVTVVPASGEDEVWITIVRAINGENKIYIEKFQSRLLDIRKENAFFVDSGIIYNGEAVTVVTGYDHLEGKTIAILADGEVLAQQKIVDGQITLSTAARNVRGGLPFASLAIPMRMDISTAVGTTHGSLKKIPEIVFSLHDTLNAKFGSSETELKDFDWTDPKWKNSSLIEGLFTGDILGHFDGGFDIDDTLIISQSDPLPCVVRGIIPRVEKVGK